MSKDISYEQARDSLHDILQKLQDENTPIEEALKLYAKAADMLSQCNELLRKVELQMEEIDVRIMESETLNDELS